MPAARSRRCSRSGARASRRRSTDCSPGSTTSCGRRRTANGCVSVDARRPSRPRCWSTRPTSAGARGTGRGGDREHFLAIASRAMRQLLIDELRRRGRQKRGEGQGEETLPDWVAGSTLGIHPEFFLDLERALAQLDRFASASAAGARVPPLRRALGRRDRGRARRFVAHRASRLDQGARLAAARAPGLVRAATASCSLVPSAAVRARSVRSPRETT